MFRIIIYFSITYYCLNNMCLYHLHRKQWLPSLALSRSISASVRKSPTAWQPTERDNPGYSQAPPTPSSCAPCLNTEGCCLNLLHLKHWGGGEGFQSPPGHTDSLCIISSCCFCQSSDLQRPVHILLWYSHILPCRKS